MTREDFIDTVRDLGFELSVDPDSPGGWDDGVLVAHNRNGDELYYSLDPDWSGDPEEEPPASAWGVHVDLEHVTFDRSYGFYEWSDLEVDGGSIVTPKASGTRSSKVGYGRSGWNGRVAVDKHGVTITETHRA